MTELSSYIHKYGLLLSLEFDLKQENLSQDFNYELINALQ